MTTYYSTQRPIGPGTYPKPQNNKVIEIKNFDKKEKIEKEDINAYAYIKYEKPLMPAAAKTYELTLALALEKTIEENKETEQPNLAAKTDEEIINAAIKKIQEQRRWMERCIKKLSTRRTSKRYPARKRCIRTS